MNRKSINFILSDKQQGLTLVEIMISMLLGIMLIGGVGKIYINSQESFRLQEALSRIQENGRFAIDYLSKQIRMAGFQGCPNLGSVVPNIIANNPPSGFDLSSSLRGYDYTGAAIPGYTLPNDVIANTDILTVQRAGGCGAGVTHAMDNENANVKVLITNTCDFQSNDVLFITDCRNADIFRASTVSNDAGNANWENIAHANNVNTTNRLSKEYDEDAEVFKFNGMEFYIRNNPAGFPSLYHGLFEGAVEELVEGVENMQITYGVEIAGAASSNYSYMTADAVTTAGFWEGVRSVRVSLLLQSVEDNLTPTSTAYDYNGATVTPGDRRLRRVFTTTVFIRNRL